MKYILIISVCLLLGMLPARSQVRLNPYWQEPTKEEADSLTSLLANTQNDTVKLVANRQLGLYFQEINRYTALSHFEAQLALARSLKLELWEAEALSRIGYVSGLMQNYAEGISSLLKAKDLAGEQTLRPDSWSSRMFTTDADPRRARLTVKASIHQHLGLLYYFAADYRTALEYFRQCLEINASIGDKALLSLIRLNMGDSYNGLNQVDSARQALSEAVHYADESGYKKYKGLAYYDLGSIATAEGDLAEAKEYFRSAVQSSLEEESNDFAGMGYVALADISRRTGVLDSGFYFARKALNIYLIMNDTLGLTSSYEQLSLAFDASNRTDSAYYYLKKFTTFKAALNKAERVTKFQAVGFGEQIKLRALEAEQLRVQNRTRTFSFIAGAAVLTILSGIFYISNRRARKDKLKIEKAYRELKATQAQLIQSEKMASLGELTAGIAHEIQNPLNFVNNFSEVSGELLEELKTAVEKGDWEEVKALATDVQQNLEKINHHGQRADGIVKGMLQHSRSSSGQKEPTDINALCDEYLRLAFHGLRAKDKSFNAKFETELDPAVGKILVLPQDMGRVILNLINNAFYAVSERKKKELSGYEPCVTVSTRKVEDTVQISIQDNGTGIPQKVIDKIFQPFFTTKPTGQGTGLGLSLSYDIVKAHEGDLTVETKEGEGTTFNIVLPAGG